MRLGTSLAITQPRLFGGLWTPDEIATAAWFDAADTATITESGGAVSQWDDKSGNANHVTQATGANQPVTNAMTINGMNVLDWGSLSNTKGLSSLLGSSNNWRDTFVVLRWDGGVTFNDFNGVMTGTSNIGLIGNVGSANAYSTEKWWDTMAINGASVLTPFAVLPALASNSILQFTANSDISVSGLAIGSDREISNRGWKGVFAEVITSETELSTTDSQKIEGYLAWKWGLEANLPADHPYKSSPPTV